jgi:predicted kinase
MTRPAARARPVRGQHDGAVLIVLAGLPGTGKSAVAEAVGRALVVPVLSVDPVEAAMHRAGIDPGQPTGLAAYAVVEAVAGEILGLGQSVVVDAVNAVEPARGMWRDLSRRYRVPLRWIEVVCTDAGLHRRRLEGRSRGLGATDELSWHDVERRRDEYEPLTDDRLLLDTTRDLATNVALALDHLRPA